MRFKRKSRLVCFKRLAAWADLLEGGTAHQAQTSAIAFKNTWFTELQIGDLPRWLSTDNCPAVVAVTNCLQIVSVRCGVHFTPFVVESATYGGGDQFCMADPMEIVAAFAYIFINKRSTKSFLARRVKAYRAQG